MKKKKKKKSYKGYKGKGKKKSSGVSFHSVKRRLNPDWDTRREKRVFKTGVDELDEVLGGGLPHGLTVIYGPGKVGKTLLAREIAKKHKALYITCEASSDPPDRKMFPKVMVADYTNPKYRPKFRKAIDQLFCLVDNIEPEITIIDSLTSFLSGSVKALPESDLREGCGIIHQLTEGKSPMIGISEVRGSGYYQSTAGGEGVMHACSMLVRMDHIYLESKFQSQKYSEAPGTDLYLFRVVGDKLGLAKTRPHRVTFDSNGYSFKEVKVNQSSIMK